MNDQTSKKLEDMQMQIDTLKLTLEEERRSNQFELNVVKRSLANLRMKLLGEEQPKMRRIS